ncbi:MAG TPA: hypothetical protein VMT30_03905 [Candidatus Saccharimonadia bacterium]|nr:hypothetical protein [Candidatus Saccharimonadia bacterium]
MSTAVYQLPLAGGLIFHAGYQAELLQDGDIDTSQLEIDAQVRSGYYFVTLATTLEAIAQKLPHEQLSSRVMLDKLTQDLEYLHQNYVIIKEPRA